MEDLVKSFEVEADGKKQGVFIAMTPEEAKDKVFVAEIEAGAREKTADQLRHQPAKPEPKYGKEHAAGALKELQEHREWHKANPNSKRYY